MELAVTKREQLGREVNALRKQGVIPAELYGRGIANVHLAVDAKQFRKVFKEAGESTIIELVLDGKKHPTIIHEVQRDALDDSVIHVDFYEVRMDEKLTAHIPVEFTGEAPAIKEFGGILNKTVSEIEVEALPSDLPHDFTVDLSMLKELNQSIYVRDLAVPKGVKVLTDSETAVVTVTEPMKEEELAPASAPDVSEVKVETEEKKAERDQEKAAGEKEESK